MGIFKNGREHSVYKNGQQMCGYANGVKMFGGSGVKHMWDYNWARVAPENGVTEVTYTDELGNAMTSACNAFIIGNRHTGELYYANNTNLYKKNLESGEVFLIKTNHRNVRMAYNDKNNAIITDDYFSYISQYPYTNNKIQAAGRKITGWQDDKYFIDINITDSSGTLIQKIPTTDGYPNKTICCKNPKGGYVVTRETTDKKGSLYVGDYDFETNTLTERCIINYDPAVFDNNMNLEWSVIPLYDKILICFVAKGNAKFWSTSDGINFVPIGASGYLYGITYAYSFVSLGYYALIDSIFWYDCVNNVIHQSADDLLFPGFVKSSYNNLNQYTFINNTVGNLGARLYDIVPK
jgi:hypothetical protein